MGLTYFISDVHLGIYSEEIEKERVKNFVQFLREVEKTASQVFFVGDLFDFWFEYQHVIPKKHFPVVHQLACMREKNIPITYLAGNHDFWLGTFFEKELGIHTYADEWTGEIDGKRFYLFHGDGVAKKDVGYRILKRFLRNRWSLRFYQLFHPDFGIPFARFVSGSSRQYTNRVDLDDREDYIAFARERFREGYDYVIMGHRHQPYVLEEDGKKYVNIGDWLVHFTYFTFDGKSLTMHSLKDRYADGVR
ncbi:MAG: UDP-2,3-diacylglucosamine diphosphatase [Calditrichales bacterium]|nr:MAG: UDP-2,3-diacylglucosamine diphosphatase [Calditrichales bacterium]